MNNNINVAKMIKWIYFIKENKDRNEEFINWE